MTTVSKTRKGLQVALDGPAGVGKTTTARGVGDALNLLYIDTGAMYRALAVKALRDGVSLDDPEAATALVRATKVQLKDSGGLQVLLDGDNVSEAIRAPEASDGASRISVHPGVREQLVAWQRKMARGRRVIMEGRDIGTVVLADADAKIFLTASSEERARRRYRDLERRGEKPSYPVVLQDIRQRDARDQGRAAAPLKPAIDAVVLDCTALSLPQQVEAVCRVIETKIKLNI